MKLSFSLDAIKYLKIYLGENDENEPLKLALVEKQETEFVAMMRATEYKDVEFPQKVSLSVVCHDGLYKTSTVLKNIEKKGDSVYFYLQNPETLDYLQNRQYFRILEEFDCVYSVETDEGQESYNATTYDISAGGVSIILPESIISPEETSIVIYTPTKNIRSHLRFIRCELHGDEYKHSFEFTDIKEEDSKILAEYCVNKQL